MSAQPSSDHETLPSTDQVTRDFTVATFVVRDLSVLLLWHRKLQMWLPPGGHIEPNELPDEAALREVAEEAGIGIELVGERGVAIDRPIQLIRPVGIQVEDIRPGHQHIDLIYFARPADRSKSDAFRNDESESIGWFDREDMTAIGVNAEVRAWADRALAELGAPPSLPGGRTWQLAENVIG